MERFPIASRRQWKEDSAASIISSLINKTTDDDIIRMKKLKEIQLIVDQQKQQDELMKYLYELTSQRDSSISRLCNQINGHIEFLLRLSNGQDPSSLFLISQQSGRTFLKEATRDFLAEQAGKSTELISSMISTPETPLYGLSKILDHYLDADMRTRVLSQLANDESVSNIELKTVLIQEAYIVQQLLKNKPQTNDHLRISIQNELEAKYQARISQLQQELAAFSHGESFGDTSNIREMLEDSIRAEYELKMKDEREKIRQQLQNEYHPVRADSSPVDTSDSKLIRELKTQITNEIRNQVIDDVRKDVWAEAEFHFRPIIKKELEPKLRERISAEIEVQLRNKLRSEVEQSVRTQLQQEVREAETNKIRQELAKSVAEEVTSKLKRKIKEDYKKQYQLQLRESELNIRNDIEKQLREKISKEYEDKMNDKIENDIKPMLETQLTVTLQRDIRQRLSQQMRDQIIDSIREEVEEEYKNKPAQNVPEYMITEMRDQIQRKLQEENRIILEKMESDLRNRIYDEVKEQTLDEVSIQYSETATNTSFPPKPVTDYKNMKEMFREELEDEIRAQITAEMRSRPLSADEENKIRSEIRTQVYNQIHDSVIDQITKEVEFKLRNEKNRNSSRISYEDISTGSPSFRNKSISESDKLRLRLEIESELRAKLEIELRSKIESELREEIENKVRAELDIQYRQSNSSPDKQRRLKSELRQIVIDEIREEFMRSASTSSPQSPRSTNKDILKLKKDIIVLLTPKIEKGLRRSFLEIEESDERTTSTKISAGGVSPTVLKSLRKQIKKEIKEKYVAILRREVEADFVGSKATTLFTLICKALAINNISFSLNAFFELTEQLASENVEIREKFEIGNQPLAFFVENLVKIIDDDDLFKTHTRSLLTRQSRQISDARSENCARTWLNWAKKLYESLIGQSFTSENIVELRLAIEESQAKIIAENALHKQKQQQQHYRGASVLNSPSPQSSPRYRL
ncbi:hypothetical protein TVAG_034620 [Trichomonas vaginalis G3]|uniref:Uncharacterized protein n=1 Tax=Trichomonas vaginalis (strain ATCC PRA-98 / G3) TaxID=412133 RepID=A2FJ72_TRIV3|nr:exported serine/threonine protein kinase family [Trichomonas vaginalis G3]EAX95033.1 hypothetical protein TVAG_034620 [Trichomonas vaginalis G3]KAI5537435.1 exported serine/threonine protein kinase family [Trichomonas vaginalis G3]|eukprot:XP_001307963.1 hypothetical protein [Trichomonas vaginalis G3]